MVQKRFGGSAGSSLRKGGKATDVGSGSAGLFSSGISGSGEIPKGWPYRLRPGPCVLIWDSHGKKASPRNAPGLRPKRLSREALCQYISDVVV